MSPRASLLLLLGLLGALGAPAGAHAEPQPIIGEAERPSDGRPTVVLDRLELPRELANAAALEKHLRATLRREVRRATWGAGRESRIEYRFAVTELSFAVSGQTLHVHCTALGKLPRGQTARSELRFGGALAERERLTRQVLDIVARGVVTRLAELERARRGLR
jgi:hypothetical protein